MLLSNQKHQGCACDVLHVVQRMLRGSVSKGALQKPCNGWSCNEDRTGVCAPVGTLSSSCGIVWMRDQVFVSTSYDHVSSKHWHPLPRVQSQPPCRSMRAGCDVQTYSCEAEKSRRGSTLPEARHSDCVVCFDGSPPSTNSTCRWETSLESAMSSCRS